MYKCERIDFKKREIKEIPQSLFSSYLINKSWFKLFGGLEKEDRYKLSSCMCIAVLDLDAMVFVEEFALKLNGLHAYEFKTVGGTMWHYDQLNDALKKFINSKDIEALEKVVKENHIFTVEMLNELCGNSWKEIHYHNDDWEEMKKEYTKQYEVD